MSKRTYLDDLEDRYAGIVAGESKTTPLEEVMKEFDLTESPLLPQEGFLIPTRPTTSSNT